MTNHRDPIEEWLSEDVDLLQPPQGAFRKVRRRARRRKAVQAMSAAAAAAVVVAAAVSLPQVAGNLFSGPSSGPQKYLTGTPESATRTSAKATSRTPHPPA